MSENSVLFCGIRKHDAECPLFRPYTFVCLLKKSTETNYAMDTTGEKEKRTYKENVGGRSTSSHDNKKLRTRSMEKQRGMAFGFRKTATAVKNAR